MMDRKEKIIVQDFIMQLEQIDYLEILDIIRPLLIYYIASKTLDTYTLHRDYKPAKISKVVLPPELNTEYSELDIKKIAAKKYGEHILKFAKVIIKNFSAEDLINFYNNINDLKTKQKKFIIRNLLLGSKFVGEYDLIDNEITIDDDTAELSIYHELFHMASSTYRDKIKYSGFHQTYYKKGIISLGKGINEGYTELLSRRYFGNLTNAYEYEVLVAEKLEQIIGKEKMQSLYLNSNLKGLIDELKQYISEDEVMKFISNADFLVIHLNDKKLRLFEKSMITNCLKNINKFLIICYSNKLLQQFKDTNSKEYNKLFQELMRFASSLPSSITIRKHKYEALTQEVILESIQASFEDRDINITINKK